LKHAEKLVSGAMGLVGAVVALPVRAINLKVQSRHLEDVAQGVHGATKQTGHILGRAADGIYGLGKGAVTRNGDCAMEGLRDMGSACATLGKGFVGGAVLTAQGVIQTGQGICVGDLEQVKAGATQLVKVAAVGALAIGAFDLAFDLDAGEWNQGEAFASVDRVPGLGDGVAGAAEIDGLIQDGALADTSFIEDPLRSQAQVDAFLAQNGFTQTPAGYEVHHIVPLSQGGADTPSNMVLVTIDEHDAITQAHRRFYGW